MDAFQQPHRLFRPPPPPPPPTSASLVPPQGPWYSGQFQYHHPSASQPPSPSPPPSQWPPPQHPSDHHLPPGPPYPAPPLAHNLAPPSYHARPSQSQFPPPPPPLQPLAHTPPPPHLPPAYHHPHPYPQANQEWGNSHWAQHQGWEYPAHNSEEDLAARARAWAAANAAMENQHSQSQFTPNSRSNEQSHYHDQYSQTVDPQYLDFQQHSLSTSSYQQYAAPSGPLHRPAMAHLQDPALISSGSSSYVYDGHLPYAARDGTLAGESNAGFPHQESLPTSPFVHRQEVPSSYSSVTGKEVASNQNEQLYNSLSFPIPSDQQGQNPVQSSLPSLGLGGSVLSEQPHFAYGHQSANQAMDLSDQPLDFAPRFNQELDPHVHSSYAHHDSVGSARGNEPGASLTSIQHWTPTIVPGSIYPPTGLQHDPSLAVPSPIPVAMIGRVPGQSFQPPVPSVSASFSIGAGNPLHPATAFSADAYGVSGISERPRKASVPNWLREEIIKKKAAITTSSAIEHPNEDTESLEDEAIDRSSRKGDQADSKSFESSRSTEEEDDDEVNAEAARTTAINQEIKRVLTEVLLKVTDELFDEIATKVLNEHNLKAEDLNTVALDHKLSPSAPKSKPSAKVLIPVIPRESETDNVVENSISHPPGDLLGLANYASDDDEGNEEVEGSRMQNYEENTVQQHSSAKTFAVENDSSKVEIVENDEFQSNLGSDLSKGNPIKNKNNSGVGVTQSDKRVGRELLHHSASPPYFSKGSSEVEGLTALESKDMEERVSMKPILPEEENLMVGDSQGRDSRIRLDKNDRNELIGSAGLDIVKEVGSEKKVDESHKRLDERHLRKEKTDERNGSKERMRQPETNHVEKAKESDPRKKSSHLDGKDRKEIERLKKSSDRDDTYRLREKANHGKGDRSRHKSVNESSRHKRGRSPSGSGRGKNSKDHSVVSYTNDSSDESEEDSRRKVHSRRRKSSPSPVRSKRRQVSRSPHSRRSQRRHSPYSSLETTRGTRRSRSKSPVHRKR